MASGDEFFGKFRRQWPGGFFEGDPLDPMGQSHYSAFGFNSILYTVYVACIRPYVGQDTTVLEIGPGRGAWTKAFLECGSQKVYAVDAAPPEHTCFWDYIGKTERVEYITSSDLTLSAVPDDAIDYFFSFGVFCHLKPEMCETYIASLAPKLRRGAECFLMIADFDKYNDCIDNVDRTSLKKFFSEQTRKAWQPAKWGYLISWRYLGSKSRLERVSKEKEQNVAGDGSGASWYHWGLERACAAIEREGLEVVEPDVRIVARDPIIHFRKRESSSSQ